MTIEEIKKALRDGKSTDALLKEFNAQLKKAQAEVTAEKEKNIKLDTARRRLATAIASYATELFDEVEVDVAGIIVMLKGFEDDISNPTLNILKGFPKVENKKSFTKEGLNDTVNKVTYPRKTESDDDILQAFFELFK
jgi:hypothetical protein